MKVRYSYLKQQFSNSGDLWIKLKKFVSTGDFTLGKELTKFEKNFAKLIGTKCEAFPSSLPRYCAQNRKGRY